ncbi:jg25006, partial [Pararge aegeria aegeria]
VTRACWRAAEWGSARKGLNPGLKEAMGSSARGRLMLGRTEVQATIRVKGLRTVISPHASENV